MENSADTLRLDKTSFSVVSLSDHIDDNTYWRDQRPIERLRHIEVLRKINYGHRATYRLQRIFEYTSE